MISPPTTFTTAFLGNYLPAAVLEHIELDSLAICKETFVDTKQASHYSDVLYQVDLKGATGMYSLKAVHHKQTNRIILEIFKCVDQLGEDEYSMQWMRMVWQYVAEAVDIESKEIAELAQQNLSGTKEAEIMTLAQRLEQQGEARGIVMGRTEGRTEGEAVGRHALLPRQLTRKLGPQTLTPAVQQRLQSASIDQLDYWGERILDAKSVRDVFADN